MNQEHVTWRMLWKKGLSRSLPHSNLSAQWSKIPGIIGLCNDKTWISYSRRMRWVILTYHLYVEICFALAIKNKRLSAVIFLQYHSVYTLWLTRIYYVYSTLKESRIRLSLKPYPTFELHDCTFIVCNFFFVHHIRHTWRYAVVYHIHDDVIKLKHLPRYWPFVRGIIELRRIWLVFLWFHLT